MVEIGRATVADSLSSLHSFVTFQESSCIAKSDPGVLASLLSPYCFGSKTPPSSQQLNLQPWNHKALQLHRQDKQQTKGS